MLNYLTSPSSRPQLAELCQQAADVVVPYSEEYEQAHMDFAAKMWPAKGRRRNSTYNRWKFRGAKRGQVEGLLLAINDGKVIGQLGLIPVTARIGEEDYPCQWACDLMVDASVRRKGIGSLLLAKAMSRDVITLGSNPGAAADVVMARLGFRPLVGPRLMVLPLQLSEVMSWKVPRSLSRMIPLLSIMGQPLVILRQRALAKAKPRVKATSCKWEEVVDLIQQHQATFTNPHVRHDPEFLQWRCSGLAHLSPELQAVKTESGGYAIVGAASPAFYVYDWSARDREEFLALFHLIYQIARAAKVETIQALAQDESEESWLKSVNFLGFRQRFKIICYPEQPLARQQYFRYSIFDSDGNL
jgi:GNAT superfamily N-acetyltransferase